MLESIKKIFSGSDEETTVNSTVKPDISREKSAELYEISKPDEPTFEKSYNLKWYIFINIS